MVVFADRAEPEGQGEAQQEVDVGDGEVSRVSTIQEREEQLVKGLPTWPHAEHVDQLHNGENAEWNGKDAEWNGKDAERNDAEWNRERKWDGSEWNGKDAEWNRNGKDAQWNRNRKDAEWKWEGCRMEMGRMQNGRIQMGTSMEHGSRHKD